MSKSKQVNQWWIKRTCHGCDNAYRSPLDCDGFHGELIQVQEVEQITSPMSLAQEAYEAYQSASKASTTAFVDLTIDEKSAWMVTAGWVAGRVLRFHQQRNEAAEADE